MLLLALFASFIWALAWLGFDSYNTSKGIKAGVANEGNGWITIFWGSHPNLWQLWSVDGSIRLAILLAALFVPSSEAYPQAWRAMGVGAFIAAGFKNWQGGRQWKWMFSHPGQTIPQMGSAWAQFLGFWG